MKTNIFFDWTLILDEGLNPVIDEQNKKMVIIDRSIELNAVIWLDENDLLQLKPTWDCVISIDDKNKTITIRHADFLRENN
ncbi:hypothetical protein [Exiguobacterium sp. NG55]|uniref:hypothetical protein n=1 Tax=Exiguobacterium sp. NG55 TaxID=375477 RepID=UPI0004DF044A|nr:hypothetical protein [Exiguobacterium sp. NG55]